jgi:hypothetical protein
MELRSTVHILGDPTVLLFSISHLAIPVMEVLVTPSRDRRGSEMELRSTVHVLGDPTVLIFSQSRISRFL